MLFIEINNKEVGNRIRLIRLKLGDTMEKFGNRFNTSKGTVNNWEKSRNLPNKENLKNIAELGGISVDELLYGTTEEEFNKAEELLTKIVNDDNRHYFDVDDETRKNLISIAIENNKSLFLNKHRNENELELLGLYLENTFEEYYFENVISDTSAISMTLNDLISLKEKISEYYQKDDIYSFSDELSVFITLEEKNLNQEIGNEISRDLDNLIDKYFDKLKTTKDTQTKSKLKMKLIGTFVEKSTNDVLNGYLEEFGEEKFKEDIYNAINFFWKRNKHKLKQIQKEEFINKYREDIEKFIDDNTISDN